MTTLNLRLKPKPLPALMTAQFISAFVDNMILFITLAIIQRDNYPDYYLPVVQLAFIFSYIILAPWVGKLADKHPKSNILMVGTGLKALGILMLFFGIDPALSYAVVGIGAVVYSPAKYGILPDLTQGEDELLKANSQIESYTILAILTGTIAGGYLSDLSITLSLLVCLILYGLSLFVNTFIPRIKGDYNITYTHALREFKTDTLQLLKDVHGHFTLLGNGSFWMAAAVLRLVVIVWLAKALGITDNTTTSMILATTGIGIAVGAAVTPYLVTVKAYTRSIFYGLAMALSVFAFVFIDTLPFTIFFLLLIGTLGGIFIVPMNTRLQQVGQLSPGPGKTISIQNFIENVMMFIGLGIYAPAATLGIEPNTAIIAIGIALLAMIIYLFVFRLRANLSSYGRHESF